MAGLPLFQISTQQDPYWEIPLFEADGTPLSVDGRTFEAWVAPATTADGVGEGAAPIKVLRFGDGLSLVTPTDGSPSEARNTFVHQMSKAFAQANLPRGELTADILEVVDGKRRLFIPVRLRYADPASIREFVADRVGVSYGEGRQPILTPVAIAGQVGQRGAGILSGSGPPTPADGEDRDYWIDVAADQKLIYGPKENGIWPTTGEPVTSNLTPELEALREATVAAAEQTALHAETTQSDRQIVEASTAEVVVARADVLGAQAQVSSDRGDVLAARSDVTAARTETLDARNTALEAEMSAEASRLAAQIAASNAQEYAELLGVAAFDFSFDSDPVATDDWSV